MAKPGNAGDSADAVQHRAGRTGSGAFVLPNGLSFANDAHVLQWLAQNHDYVWAHRGWLKSQLGGDALSRIGLNISGDGKHMVYSEGGTTKRVWTVNTKEGAKLKKAYGAVPGAPEVSVGNASQAAADKGSPASAGRPNPTTIHDRPAPVATSQAAAPSAGGVVATTPASAPFNPGADMTAGLSKKAQAIIAGALGTKLPGAQPVNVNALVNQLGSNYSDDLISSLAGSDSINRSIDYLKSLVDQNTRDTAQAGRNIDSWYGEVGNSLATAAARDKAINAASLSSIQDVSKGIASAIGGEAAPGAGQVAATGAQGAQLIGAMGNINSEYNSDLAPLIQMEAAGAKSQATSEGAQRAADLQGQIIDQENTRDKNVADARVQLAQLNHDLDQQRATTRLQAMGFNNDIGQQGFQNNLARGQSLLAAANFGLDVSTLGANINTNAAKLATSAAIAGQKSADARAKARAKALAPPSASSLRDSYKTAFQAVNALKQTGTLNVNNGVQAVKSAYGITAQSNRAARQAAYTAAQQALPGVQVDRRWFGLGA